MLSASRPARRSSVAVATDNDRVPPNRLGVHVHGVERDVLTAERRRALAPRTSQHLDRLIGAGSPPFELTPPRRIANCDRRPAPDRAMAGLASPT
jgi:hypothetical protein